ncbi:MAG: cohesin domain-containing protein [Clostridia bacterium]|nr:cohesin domain-containing protein [Clostridia bacterium]
MKKYISFSILMIILILSNIPSAFAVDAEYKVNGEKVVPNDVITYTVSIEDLKADVMAINAHVIYDQEVLSLVAGGVKQGSIKFGDAMGGVIYNEVLENRFLFNCAQGSDHIYFEDDNMIVQLNFLAQDVSEKYGKDIELSFEFLEIYNTDGVTMHEGTDYSINAVAEFNTYEGDLDLVDKSQQSINADATASSQDSPNNADKGNKSEVVDDSSEIAGENMLPIVIACCVIAVVLIAIVIVLIVGKKRENNV